MTSEQLLEISTDELEKMDDNELLILLGPLLRHTRPTDETRKKKSVIKELDLEDMAATTRVQTINEIKPKVKKLTAAEKLQETINEAMKMVELGNK